MLSSPIEEIKNRLDVVDVIGAYIRMQKAGANYRAVCPFHSEKKPSLFISPARQIWHCFGCGAGSNIFDFVMKIEGVEFGDALRILAQKAGVELKREDPKLRTKRQRLYEICELAAKFFEGQLAKSKTGQEAQGYLLDRGVSKESLKKWRLGYSPEGWTGLCDFLVGQGYTRNEAVEAGLAIYKENGGKYFDRFRARIMFPVFDGHGQVIGFGGRIFKIEDTAKYVNSPATMLYDKSRVLYGLDRAKIAIRKNNFCILVEGYMDAIMMMQAGYENVVAASGTALTMPQLQILKRYTDSIYTAFDMDIAGDSATKRGIDLAQAAGFNVKTIIMPEGKDPADIVAENKEFLPELISDARNIMDFYFETTLAKFDCATVDGKNKISKILLPVIKRVPSAIERAHWRHKLAQMLRVKEEDIETELKKIKIEASQFQGQASQEPQEIDIRLAQKSRREILEERIVSLLLRYRNKAEFVGENHLHFFSEKFKPLLTNLKIKDAAIFAMAPSIDKNIEYLLLLAESEDQEEEKEIEAELVLSLQELTRLGQRERMEKMVAEIKEAELIKDHTRLKSLMEEFNALAREAEI